MAVRRPLVFLDDNSVGELPAGDDLPARDAGANLVWAGPAASGADAPPTFRQLVNLDLPAGIDVREHLSVGGTNFYAHPTLPRIGVGTDDPLYGVHVTGPSAGIYVSRDHNTQEPFVLLVAQDDLLTGGQIRGLHAGGLRFTNGAGNETWASIAPGVITGFFTVHGGVQIQTNTPALDLFSSNLVNGWRLIANISNVSDFGLQIRTIDTATHYLFHQNSFQGRADNTKSLGLSGWRWSQVYAVNGSINTSDAREKDLIRDMTPAEIAAGLDIARLPPIWKWLHAINEKGEAGARWHVSPPAQEVIAVMERHGLDPYAYGFVCYDAWPEVEEVVEHHPAVEAVVEEWPDLFDAAGSLVQPAGSRVVREAVEAYDEIVQEAQEAGDRYSLRPNELGAFVQRALVADRDALEQRIAALEQAA